MLSPSSGIYRAILEQGRKFTIQSLTQLESNVTLFPAIKPCPHRVYGPTGADPQHRGVKGTYKSRLFNVCLQRGMRPNRNCSERPEHNDGKHRQVDRTAGVHRSHDHNESRRSPKDRRREAGGRQNVIPSAKCEPVRTKQPKGDHASPITYTMSSWKPAMPGLGTRTCKRDLSDQPFICQEVR